MKSEAELESTTFIEPTTFKIKSKEIEIIPEKIQSKERRSRSKGGSAANREVIAAGSPPNDSNQVAITFVTSLKTSETKTNLGNPDIGETITKYIDSHEYENDEGRYKFNQDGFECINIDQETQGKIREIIEESQQLDPKNIPTSSHWTDDKYQKAIDELQIFVEKKYKELTGKRNIQVIASRHLIFRIAGIPEGSNQIPGNPLTHLDYNNFKNAKDRQCQPFGTDERFHLKCPDSELIDFINIWFPTTDVKDWPLGFLVSKNNGGVADIPIEDYKTIQIVSGSIASSIEPRDDVKVAYKKNMKLGDAYLFRSATQFTEQPGGIDLNNPIQNKKGLYHGSFRISHEPHQRRSIELRFLIFEKEESFSSRNSNGRRGSVGKKKFRSFRTRKPTGKGVRLMRLSRRSIKSKK